MHEIMIYLKKIHNKLESERSNAYRKFQLTSTQLDTLEYLNYAPAGKNTLTDIAGFFGVKHTSVIHVLKILEEKEFIYRDSNTCGTHSKPICLTDNGKRIIADIEKKKPLINAAVLSGITPKDQQYLTVMLKKIYENLESANLKDI